MKQTWKKRAKMILGCLMLCLTATVCMPGLRSEAASKKPVCPKSQTVYLLNWGGGYTEPTGYSKYIFIKNLASDAEITNIKSSKKSVECNNMGKFLEVSGAKIKSGTKAKITFRVKQNNKTYSLSCNLTFKKRTAPFSSLKMGGKNYAKKVTNQVNVNLKPSYKKATFSVKMKSGRKLLSIELHRGDKLTKVKNGSKIALKKGDVIFINYKYTKRPSYMPKNLKWTETDCVRIFVK